MTTEKLTEILENHKKWLNREPDGIRANLRSANLRSADLRSANLRSADLRSANLSGADLSGADIRSADLSGADLSGADLRSADLRSADLRSANLRSANLRSADLRSATGLLSAINFMESHFERTENGYIAYKTFGSQYEPPKAWKIESGSIITENVNFNRTQECGSGINVAPLEWVKKHYKGDIWRVLIRWEWLPGVCVPYNTDGKIRCEKVELIGVV